MKQTKVIGTLLVTAWLSGCASYEISSLPQGAQPGDPDWAPVPSESLLPPPSNNGSLYNAAYGMSLYGDKKAMHTGDIITVLLEEQTQGRKSSQANSSKSSEAGLNAPILAGGGAIDALSASISGDRNFSGRGTADQSNSLSGSISVTVSEVLPNGVLRVRGEKWITLNTGAEFIRIQGMLRPEDINLDNTVSSQKLADARISYSGEGALANASQPGWLTRFFHSPIWPF